MLTHSQGKLLIILPTGNAWLDVGELALPSGTTRHDHQLTYKLPILMVETPESYSIAAYLVVGVQLGNLIGFACALLQSYTKIRSPLLVAGILIFTLVVDVLLALKWNTTSKLFGKDRRFPASALFLMF